MRHLPWNRDKQYPMLIEPCRERLARAGVPYIIENVQGAAAVMRTGWLCGTMFGKRFYRHRLFKANFLWLSPPHEIHRATIRRGYALAGRARDILFTAEQPRGLSAWRQSHEAAGFALGRGHQPKAALARAEMDVEWMTADELSQAVPPCYSEYLAQFIPLKI